MELCHTLYIQAQNLRGNLRTVLRWYKDLSNIFTLPLQVIDKLPQNFQFSVKLLQNFQYSQFLYSSFSFSQWKEGKGGSRAPFIPRPRSLLPNYKGGPNECDCCCFMDQ